MKFIMAFDQHSDYEEYISGCTMNLNVSACHDDKLAHYLHNDYFSIVPLRNDEICGVHFKYEGIGYNQTKADFLYSLDFGETWETLRYNFTLDNTGSTADIIIENGDYLMLKSNNLMEHAGKYKCEITGTVSLRGDLTTLVNEEGNVETLPNSAFTGFFSGCTGITTSPKLPSKNIGTYCYSSMFMGCALLTKAPELPATILASYCYSMMFRGCTGLTKTQRIKATNLTTGCYKNMFDGCVRLKHIEALLSRPAVNGETENWVRGVFVTGTFVKNKNYRYKTRGDNYIPKNWVIEDSE